MVLRHRAAAVEAVDHGEAQIEQPAISAAGLARPGADPQHRPLRARSTRAASSSSSAVGRRRGRRDRQYETVQHRRALDLHALQIDRHFDADRTRRRRERLRRRHGSAPQAPAAPSESDRPILHTERIMPSWSYGIMHRAHLAIGEFRRSSGR